MSEWELLVCRHRVQGLHQHQHVVMVVVGQKKLRDGLRSRGGRLQWVVVHEQGGEPTLTYIAE